MSSLRQALVFFLLSTLFAAKCLHIYGHSLFQHNSPTSEFDCGLSRRELRRFSSGEEGRWIITESGLESLYGDIQTLVNCTEEGDVLLFDVETPVLPSGLITIPWNLTLSSFVEDLRMENGTFTEARRKTTILCPREDEGVFFVKARDCLLANFVFRNCSLRHRGRDVSYGIFTTASCNASQNSSTIGLHHVDFEANFLDQIPALYVQEPPCSAIKIIDVNFQNNSCIGTCAASLVGRTEIQDIGLTGNRFFEEDVRAPVLISARSGSNVTIDGLTASGNNGTIVYVHNSSLRMRSSHIFQNSGVATQNRYYSGGVTLVHSSGHIVDCRFEENKGHIGPSIAVQNSSVVITRTSVIGNIATRYGGGISITLSSTARILDSVIANNSAGLNGGGVYAYDTADLQIENTTFQFNSAERGGGIYGNEPIRASLFSCHFVRNRASDSGGGALLEDGDYTVEGNTFEENTSDEYGGGFTCFHSRLNVSDTTFLRNSASTNGGGSNVYGNSTSRFANCTWETNFAGHSGGGALFDAGFDAVINNSTFHLNRAELGAGVYATGSNITLRSVVGNNNAVSRSGAVLYLIRSNGTVSDCWFARNSAGDGGAICLYESATSISTSRFVSNEAMDNGGAISCVEWSNSTIADCLFASNSANSSGGSIYVSESVAYATNLRFQSNTAEHGGALYSHDSITRVSASSFVSNKVLSHGGAIGCVESSSLSIEDCSFATNFANRSGGAIIATGSVVSATNLRFQNNRALRFGGAVFLQSTTTASLVHSVFFNESSGYRGGALSATGTELKLRNISIASCSAVHGGGVYLERTSANINETSVTLCEASESGGGIRMIQSNVTSRGINVSFNSAVGTSIYTSVGGGIAVDISSSLFIKNASLDGNKAQFGAGILSGGESVVNISNGRFLYNSAKIAGGVAFLRSSSLTLQTVLFVGNSASFGGSFYVQNSSLDMNYSRLFSSSSPDAGGSVLARGGSTVVMLITTIQSSSAANGGGIMLTNANLRGFRVQFLNCSAREHGGGVGLNESSSFLCTECLFEGNSALQEGGALRLESLKPQMLAFQLENTVFRENDADFGGAIHFQTGDGSANCSEVNSTKCTFLAVTGCSFTNNHARSAGGAILANNPMAIRISCDPIDKADRFTYYTHEELGTFGKVSSLDVMCNNWTENTAATYGPIIGSYAKRVSTTLVFGQNKTEEMHNTRYILREHRSGVALPTILLEVIDELGQGPALIQGDQPIDAVMTSPGGLFVGNVTRRMEDSRGNFSGITGYQEPGNYDIHIDFSEGGIPTLIIVVEIRRCAIGETSVGNGTLCEPCSEDTYNFHPPSKEDGCTPCPNNAKCDSVAIRPEKGFWHKSPCSSRVQQCLSERACDDENREIRLLELAYSIENCTFDEEFVSNYSEALCREGYTGPLCGSCKASHGKTRSFRCEQCYGGFVNVLLVVLAAIWLLALSAYTINGTLPPPTHPASGNQTVHEGSYPRSGSSIEMVATQRTGTGQRETPFTAQIPSEASANTPTMQQQGQRDAKLAECKATATFTITINYLQVIAIAVALNVEWTGALIALFETAEFIGGLTSEAASRPIDCLISADSSTPRSAVRTIVDLIVPVVVAAACAVFWTMVTIKNRQEYNYLMKRCLLSVLVVSYFSYISVTRAAVNTLYCVGVHESVDFDNDSITKYWAVDTALKCYSGSHSVLASVCGWPVMVLFSVGYPALTACVLATKRKRGTSNSSSLSEIAGFLYKPYNEKFIFWESVVLVRKAALAIIVVFAYPLGGNLPGILAVCVLVIALFFHFICRPYKPDLATLNGLEGLSLFVSCLTFASSLLFNDDHTSSEARATIAVFLIIGHVGIFLYFCARSFISGTEYLEIVLKSEGVLHNEQSSSCHIIKAYMNSRINKLFACARSCFEANVPTNDQGPGTGAVAIEIPGVQ